MKKTTILFFLFFSRLAFGQVSNLSHIPFGGDFVGWQTGFTQDLDLSNEDPYSINFYTNGYNGTGTSWQNMRMKIYDDPSLPFNSGYVGIGDFSTYTPQSLLHSLIDATTDVYHQWTNKTTGHTKTDGLQIGIDQKGVTKFLQWEDQPMIFYTSTEGKNSYSKTKC